MTYKIKVGVLGGGLAAQVIYLPRLVQLSERFELVSLSEPSFRVRDNLKDLYTIPHLYADWKDQIDGASLDAVIICGPNGLHEDMVNAAIERRLHCLVEKPICIVPDAANRLATAAESAGVVLQVGYMKRHDDATRMFLEAIRDTHELPLIVDALTCDPGLRSYFTPPIIESGGDVPPTTLNELASAEQLQAQSIAIDLVESERRCLIDVYLGALIHDVNLIAAIADAAGIPILKTSASAYWQAGSAAMIRGELENEAPWASTWLLAPSFAAFKESIRVVLPSGVHALEFSAPYGDLKVHATKYRSTTSRGSILREFVDRSFTKELESFHNSIVLGSQIINSGRQAAEDVRILAQGFCQSKGFPDVVSSSQINSNVKK